MSEVKITMILWESPEVIITWILPSFENFLNLRYNAEKKLKTINPNHHKKWNKDCYNNDDIVESFLYVLNK